MNHSPAATLASLAAGGEALVTRLAGEGTIRHRLLDLGLVPGTRVKALRRSPLGDPTAYLIRGAVIALRAEEAGLVLVRPVNTAGPSHPTGLYRKGGRGMKSPSPQAGDLYRCFNVKKSSPEQPVVALTGNPNTGKSTLFNALTGLKQHTGNWPGKTVLQAQGTYTHRGREFILVDLPGTYSLLANSAEEEVARDFLCFARPDATVVVTDATCLERNLNLVLQVLEITPRVVVCVNLMDEARRKGISIDLAALADELGVPAAGTVARTGEGLPELLDLVHALATGKLVTSPRPVRYRPEVEAAARRYLAPPSPGPEGVTTSQ